MIRFLHIGRRESALPASPFGSSLERIREIRDEADWEPRTKPNRHIQQRASRVSQVRRQVQIPCLASEREIDIPGSRSLREWLFLRGPVIVGIAVLLSILVVLIAMLLFS